MVYQKQEQGLLSILRQVSVQGLQIGLLILVICQAWLRRGASPIPNYNDQVAPVATVVLDEGWIKEIFSSEEQLVLAKESILELSTGEAAIFSDPYFMATDGSNLSLNPIGTQSGSPTPLKTETGIPSGSSSALQTEAEEFKGLVERLEANKLKKRPMTNEARISEPEARTVKERVEVPRQRTSTFSENAPSSSRQTTSSLLEWPLTQEEIASNEGSRELGSGNFAELFNALTIDSELSEVFEPRDAPSSPLQDQDTTSKFSLRRYSSWMRMPGRSCLSFNVQSGEQISKISEVSKIQKEVLNTSSEDLGYNPTSFAPSKVKQSKKYTVYPPVGPYPSSEIIDSDISVQLSHSSINSSEAENLKVVQNVTRASTLRKSKTLKTGETLITRSVKDLSIEQPTAGRLRAWSVNSN